MMKEIQVNDPRLTFAAVEAIERQDKGEPRSWENAPSRTLGYRAAEAIRLDSTTVGST